MCGHVSAKVLSHLCWSSKLLFRRKSFVLYTSKKNTFVVYINIPSNVIQSRFCVLAICVAVSMFRQIKVLPNTCFMAREYASSYFNLEIIGIASYKKKEMLNVTSSLIPLNMCYRNINSMHIRNNPYTTIVLNKPDPGWWRKILLK